MFMLTDFSLTLLIFKQVYLKDQSWDNSSTSFSPMISLKSFTTTSVIATPSSTLTAKSVGPFAASLMTPASP